VAVVGGQWRADINMTPARPDPARFAIMAELGMGDCVHFPCVKRQVGGQGSASARRTAPRPMGYYQKQVKQGAQPMYNLQGCDSLASGGSTRCSRPWWLDIEIET
jgi:hypothetical protein